MSLNCSTRVYTAAKGTDDGRGARRGMLPDSTCSIRSTRILRDRCWRCRLRETTLGVSAGGASAPVGMTRSLVLCRRTRIATCTRSIAATGKVLLAVAAMLTKMQQSGHLHGGRAAVRGLRHRRGRAQMDFHRREGAGAPVHCRRQDRACGCSRYVSERFRSRHRSGLSATDKYRLNTTSTQSAQRRKEIIWILCFAARGLCVPRSSVGASAIQPTRKGSWRSQRPSEAGPKAPGLRLSSHLAQQRLVSESRLRFLESSSSDRRNCAIVSSVSPRCASTTASALWTARCPETTPRVPVLPHARFTDSFAT